MYTCAVHLYGRVVLHPAPGPMSSLPLTLCETGKGSNVGGFPWNFVGKICAVASFSV